MTSVENSIAVGIDAKLDQPTVGLTLTTHRPDFDMQRFREAVAVLFRWLRRAEGEDVQYLGLMEWTTGKSSPGKRPHMHALLKGLPRERAEPLEPEVSDRWRELTGGAWRVDCRPLRTPGGAIAYMVGHHHKREQAPPAGWSGKRIRPSRGYWSRPVKQIREEARATMRQAAARSTMLSTLTDVDVDGDVIGEVLEQLVADRLARPAPRLVKVALDGGRHRDLEATRASIRGRRGGSAS